MKKIEETILSLSNEEKIMLTNGHNFMFTNENKRLEIPSIRMSDGPHGLRVQDGSGDNGVTSSKAATCFPTAVTLANTRNPDLIKKMGNALAEEAKHYKIDVILGPGVNIKRNPLCGRNFEYFSEDPYLAGKLAGSEVVGIQEKGISSCVKHFALNNSENYRFIGNSICDIRAIREIYLKQFEYIVKDAKPDLIMSSYNRINGVYSSENSWLLNDVLRKEWGFDGVCITDWGGTHNRVNSLQAGVDIDMPGDTPICQKEIYEGLKKDKTLEKDLDKTTYNILKLVEKHSIHESYEADFKGHHELAKDLALEGAVLLKNEDSVLPLKESENIIIVGELFDKMRYQGSGSSMINPYFYKSIKDSFNEHNIKFKYVKGYKEKEISSNKELIQEAVKESKNYDKIVLFLGLTGYFCT